MGIISFPDNCKKIIQALESNNLVGACDGSLISTNNGKGGGHAYSIRGWDSDEGKISGISPTPTSTTISSLTTELFGILATTALIYSISKYTTPTKNKGTTVTIYCDNEQAIKMCREKDPAINISETLQPEYDIKMLIQQLEDLASRKNNIYVD